MGQGFLVLPCSVKTPGYGKREGVNQKIRDPDKLSTCFVDTYDNVVQLGDQAEERVIGQVLESEFALSGVARVSLAEDSVTVARNDLTTVQGIPQVLLDLFLRGVNANGVLELQGPAEDFLVGETVERTSQAVQASSEGEVGVGQGGTDQVGAKITTNTSQQNCQRQPPTEIKTQTYV